MSDSIESIDSNNIENASESVQNSASDSEFKDLIPEKETANNNFFSKIFKGKKKEKKDPWWLDFTKTVVIVVVISALFKMFVGQIYVIPSGSMRPTMVGGDESNVQGQIINTNVTNDKVFVDNFKYRFTDPKVGDVIVFKAPESWGDPYAGTRRSDNIIVHKFQDFLSVLGLQQPDEYYLTKRIIAKGGETIKCRVKDGGITVDGKLLNEPYLKNRLIKETIAFTDVCYGIEFGPILVPADRYWVMGDNRGDSADSRFHLDSFLGTIPKSNIKGKVQMVVFPFNRFQKIH